MAASTLWQALSPRLQSDSFLWRAGDCETWMFPNMVALFPDQARALTQYRTERLQAARIRAATHGYRGAMCAALSSLPLISSYKLRSPRGPQVALGVSPHGIWRVPVER